MDFAIGGVSILVLVLGLVEFAKRLGVTGNTSMILAMVLGVIIGVVYKLMTIYPVMDPWVQVAIFGLAFGLAATGIYDFGKNLSTRSN